MITFSKTQLSAYKAKQYMSSGIGLLALAVLATNAQAFKFQEWQEPTQASNPDISTYSAPVHVHKNKKLEHQNKHGKHTKHKANKNHHAINDSRYYQNSYSYQTGLAANNSLKNANKFKNKQRYKTKRKLKQQQAYQAGFNQVYYAGQQHSNKRNSNKRISYNHYQNHYRDRPAIRHEQGYYQTTPTSPWYSPHNAFKVAAHPERPAIRAHEEYQRVKDYVYAQHDYNSPYSTHYDYQVSNAELASLKRGSILSEKLYRKGKVILRTPSGIATLRIGNVSVRINESTRKVLRVINP